MRFYLALWAAKATQLLLKLLGKKATYFAGKIAIRLCPDFIGRIGKPKTILGVTGTNGKTTVSNLLTDMLEHMGVSVLSNRYGSNINAGVATALLSGANLFGRTKKQLAVLEIDERSAKLVYPYLKPDFLVITNLFRDSMRRNAHAEYIADFLTGSIPKGTKLVLNADDLISSAVAPENESVTFGIAPLHGEPPPRDSIVCDARVCPACGSSLTYDFRRYNHIGRAHCPGCGFHSPEPDYRIASVDFDAGTAVLEEQGAFYPYKRTPPCSITYITLSQPLPRSGNCPSSTLRFHRLWNTFPSLSPGLSRIKLKTKPSRSSWPRASMPLRAPDPLTMWAMKTEKRPSS